MDCVSHCAGCGIGNCDCVADTIINERSKLMSIVTTTIADNYTAEYNEHEYFDIESKNQYVNFIYDDKDKPTVSVCLKTGHCIEDRSPFEDDVQKKQYFLTKEQMRTFLLDHKQFVYDEVFENDNLENWLITDDLRNIHNEYQNKEEQAQ